MRYKLLYWKWQSSQRLVVIMDFEKARIITFTMNEYENLDEDLQEYLRCIKHLLLDNNWWYKGG
jgi:hypothetical protein